MGSFEKGSPIIGGQAVIEGVMMKNGNKVATAVQTPKKITVKKEKFSSVTKKYKPLGVPLVRGVIVLFETLIIGMRALNYSANESSEDDEELTSWQIAVTMILAFGFAIALFVLLPLYLTKLITSQGVLFDIIDGVLRMVVFIAYVLFIAQLKDIKRVFQYHGAEHKTVNCYEAKKPLTVTNVKKFSTIHRRCGTTFILIVLLISIIVFSFVTSESLLVKFIARILLLPVIAGLSYELLHLAAKKSHNIFLRALVWPGLLMQRLTTREPDKKQIEVAIKALKAVI